MSYGTAYIDIPKLNNTRKGGKGYKMPKQDKTTKQEKRTKSRAEHAKDIVIAILVTGIVAFIGGMQYASALTAKTQVVGNNTTQEAKK
jgi:hypothetical protein